MKASFEEYLEENPNCKKFTDNTGAIAVFSFLSDDSNITKMVASSEGGRPALLGCLRELEDFYDGLNERSFSFEDKFVRNSVGRMVATIMAPFGYIPVGQVNFSQTNKGRYFSSANRYEKKGVAHLQVIRKVERVMVNKIEVEIFISEMANKPLKNAHLFIASFLKNKAEPDNANIMVARIDGVKEDFLKLLSAKGAKNKKEKFEETWENLSFTEFSHNQPVNFYERLVTDTMESDLFPYGTLFEICTDERDHIDDVRATDVVANYFRPAKYQRNLYGDVIYLRVADFYYHFLKKYESKFNYDDCMKSCEAKKMSKKSESDNY